MKREENSRYGKSFFALEKIFIASSIFCYLLPLIAYLALDISINQEIMLFFGAQMLLFFSLMLYGLIKGLFPKKPSLMHRAKHRTLKPVS